MIASFDVSKITQIEKSKVPPCCSILTNQVQVISIALGEQRFLNLSFLYE